jgi:hypothetical protein
MEHCFDALVCLPRTSVEPKLDLRGLLLEACGMHGTGWYVIPLPRSVATLRAREREDEFTLGDHTDVLGLVMMRGNGSSRRVGSEQDIAVLGLEFECVKGAGEWRKVTNE